VDLVAIHGSGSVGDGVGSGEWQWFAGKVAGKCWKVGQKTHAQQRTGQWVDC